MVVAAGGLHTVVLCEDGSCLTCGLGSDGQCGHGQGPVSYTAPQLVKGLEGRQVLAAAAGDRHTVLGTSDGKVHTFGSGSHGQLGHGNYEASLVPRVVRGLLGKKKVVSVAAGALHTIVCAAHGEIFVFGANENMQLGLGFGTEQCVCTPRSLMLEC